MTGDMFIHGSLSIASTGVSWGANSTGMRFVSTTTGNTISVAGVVMAGNPFFDGVGGEWTLLGNYTNNNAGRNLTLTNGTLNLNGFTFTIANLACNNSNVRAINFGTTGKIVLIGSGVRIVDIRTATNFSASGNKLIECTYSSSVGTRTIETGTVTAVNALNISVTAGSDIVSMSNSFNDINLTGFTGTLTSGARTVFGNLAIPSGITVSGSTSATTLSGTGTQTITAGSVLDFPITDSGTGTVQLGANLTLGSTRRFTHSSGTLDLNGFNLTTAEFSSSGTSARTIATSTGSIVVTGNAATNWNLADTTNLTVTGNRTVQFTYAGATGTRNIRHGNSPGTFDDATAFNMSFTAGSDTINFTGAVRNLSMAGFTGSLTTGSTELRCTGNLTFGTGSTTTPSSFPLVLAGTSSQTVATNGVTLDFPITMSGSDVSFATALTHGAADRTFLFTSGTLRFKEGTTNNLTIFTSSGGAAKTLRSGVGGVQATLSDVSGINSLSNTTVQDINAIGGASWQAYTANGNVDAGNNTGWLFSPAASAYMYTRRKNKRIII
jgi:hypothetical protein